MDKHPSFEYFSNQSLCFRHSIPVARIDGRKNTIHFSGWLRRYAAQW